MLDKIKDHYKNPIKFVYLSFTYLKSVIQNKYLIARVKLNLPGIMIGNGIRIHQRVEVWGKGQLKIGNQTNFGVKYSGGFKSGYIQIQPRTKDSKIVIGKNVTINNNAFICCANYIEIGNNSLIGINLYMSDFEAHGTLLNDRNNIGNIGKIIIGEHVWIGSNVTILKNVSIGTGSIVAAGSVVLKGVYPSNSIIGGNPAKVVKTIEY